ncbi:MAG: hypothetical protein IPH62_11620 [Ignavibacteriae bacterium]|nr:hypothetical protein [Ignavibacteriota bacterium]
MIKKDNNLIIKSEDKCDIKYACLEKENHCCYIEKSIDNELLFITYQNRKCNYFAKYGDSKFCMCPIRKENYKKYHE